MTDKPYDGKHLAPDPPKATREGVDWRHDIDVNLRQVYLIPPTEDLPERFRTLAQQIGERNGKD